MFKVETGICVVKHDDGHWVCRRESKLGRAPEIVRLSGPHTEQEADRIAREQVVAEADKAKAEAALRASKGRGRGGSKPASKASCVAIGRSINPKMGDDDGD